MAREKAAPTRIQRAGNGHSYYLDGEKVPGVTTIISNGIPKNGLIDWAARGPADFVINRLRPARRGNGELTYLADEVVTDLLAWNRTRNRPERIDENTNLDRLALTKILKDIRYRDLDEASGRGTEVHGYAERLARGEEVHPPEALRHHVDSYVRFLDEWQPTEALLERVVVNRRHRYMGKLDMLAYFAHLPDQLADEIGADAGWGLLDIKTARSGIFAEVALQLEGYANCETMLDGDVEVPFRRPDFLAAVHVRADDYDVWTFGGRWQPDSDEFRTFLYAKFVGEWLDWKNGPAASIRRGPHDAPHIPEETAP